MKVGLCFRLMLYVTKSFEYFTVDEEHCLPNDGCIAERSKRKSGLLLVCFHTTVSEGEKLDVFFFELKG